MQRAISAYYHFLSYVQIRKQGIRMTFRLKNAVYRHVRAGADYVGDFVNVKFYVAGRAPQRRAGRSFWPDTRQRGKVLQLFRTYGADGTAGANGSGDGADGAARTARTIEARFNGVLSTWRAATR